jgi:hypothetical protein
VLGYRLIRFQYRESPEIQAGGDTSPQEHGPVVGYMQYSAELEEQAETDETQRSRGTQLGVLPQIRSDPMHEHGVLDWPDGLEEKGQQDNRGYCGNRMTEECQWDGEGKGTHRDEQEHHAWTPCPVGPVGKYERTDDTDSLEQAEQHTNACMAVSVVADYDLQVRNQNCRYRVDEKRGQVQLRHRPSVCLCRKKDNRSEWEYF